MKRIALVGMGVVVGFGAALGVMSAKGADDASAYRQLDLFSDAFERVRANYVRPVQDRELISAAIQGMVASLAARLEEFPNDPEGWVRLVRSYAVLGDTAKRDATMAEAQKRYARDPQVLGALSEAVRAEPMR